MPAHQQTRRHLRRTGNQILSMSVSRREGCPAWPRSRSTSILAQCRPHLSNTCPARPLFLRILRKLEVTTTFKHKKSDPARAGFDPS
jgi:hypothetical protein